ncbi:ATP-binding cassette domain-containing protein [Gracilibacillus saliphilus]|uniref:ATP-binding cassette domain-containing protein n=1 Tax=Gracilibacillus saliphilus TaxID=543890 RepID=UPI0013D483F4|nr:ABC transporter ATP-binding protein [Gracilibacillus saliphilus]
MSIDVSVENVSKEFRQFIALKDISFKLEFGHIYGLIGRNGAGKTTLLSLLASLMEPSSGHIKIGGETPFENRSVMPYVSFIVEVDYNDEYEPITSYFDFAKEYRPNFDIEYAKELARRFKLPLDKPIRSLSSGMQSALNVTLGLAHRNPVTIFDEAYVSMDAPTREIFYQEVIEEQQRHPRIMILSTHLVSEMDYLFDHVLILDHGRLIMDESFEEVISQGVSVIGEKEKVDSFVNNRKILSTQSLGNTKSVMLYGNLSDTDTVEAEKLGLEIGPVSLQDLFIHLTKEGE